ncbi:DUF1365 domain-containing protein [Streptomyces sp. NPDC001941]|uniref:DUF1365 domain-containing protein n=1 Tax=Streptomyces sp. NPDC001941 TaxID=3154659 RepID=UPI00332FEB3F
MRLVADTRPPRTTAALYDCVVSHARTGRVRHSFRHRTFLWLIDPDDPPRLPRPLRAAARFDPRDHFGGHAPTIRAALDDYLAAQGVDLGGGRVRMLTGARVWGYVFNPITLYWCHDAEGAPVCVVAEVHNTYGQRHCYLLRPDDDGYADVAKDFYVSPFFPVDGAYRMRVPEPAAALSVTVRLRLDGDVPFTAVLTGERRGATPGALLRLLARNPWPTAKVSADIRRHGVRLFLRGLPVHARPAHPTQEGLR